MNSNYQRPRLVVHLFLAAWLPLLGASALDAAGSAPGLDTNPLPSCAWPQDAARHILARSIGSFAVRDGTVTSAVAMLRDQWNIPLSLIESDDVAQVISISLSNVTVQTVLDRLVSAAPNYRYDTISGHVVIYPRGAKWKKRLDIGAALGPGPREKIALQLAQQISAKMVDFHRFAFLLVGNGNSVAFREPIMIDGAGSVLDLLVRLLGRRPSVVFAVLMVPSMGVQQLFLGGVPYWKEFRLTLPTKSMHPGEIAQLKVAGTLADGTSFDLASAACGSIYLTGDEKLVSVSPDGMVTALGTGDSWVEVENGDERDIVAIRVTGRP